MEDNPQTENIVEQVQNEPVKKKSQFLLPLILFFIFILFSVLLYFLLIREGNPLQYLFKPQTTESIEKKESTDSAAMATTTINKLLSYVGEKQFYKDAKAKFSEVKKVSMLWVSDDNWTIFIPEADNSSIASIDAYQQLNDENSYTRNILKTINDYFQNNGFSKNSRNTSLSYQDETFYDYIEGYQKDNIHCLTTVNPDNGKYQDPETKEMKSIPTISISCSSSRYKESYDKQVPFLKALDQHTVWIDIQKEEEYTAIGGVHGRRTGSTAFFYRRNNIWEEVYVGLSIPSCEEFKDKNIPQEYLPDCIEESDAGKQIIYTKNRMGELWAKDLVTGKEKSVFPGIDPLSPHGDMGYGIRSFSISPDGKKIVADEVFYEGEVGLGYVDTSEKDNKVHYLCKGSHPKWSALDNIILYRTYESNNKNPWKIINLKTGEITSLSINGSGFIGWFSKNEALFTSSELGSVYIVNILSGDVRKIVSKDMIDLGVGINWAMISAQKDKLIVQVSLASVPDSYGIINVDGSGFRYLNQFTRNELTWGYMGITWSPNGQKIAIKDWSHNHDPLKDGNRKLKILDLEGNTIKTVDILTDPSIRMLWKKVGETEYIICGVDNEEKDGVAIYNVNKGTTEILDSTFGIDAVEFDTNF